MPLPSTDGQRINPGESYTPNTAALQQMGANTGQIRKLQDQNQAISKVLDNISARLGNVTNIRTNVQSATFEAFGNNFLTRGMTQMTSAITDSLSSLFEKEKEPEEDPVIKAIKEQTEVSKEILNKSLTNNKQIVGLLTDQSKNSHLLLELAKHPRANEQLSKDSEKQRTILYKQENTLKEILTALVDNSGTEGLTRSSKVAEGDVIEEATGKPQTPEEAEAAKSSKRKYRTNKKGRKFAPISEEAVSKVFEKEGGVKGTFQKRYAASNEPFAVFGSMAKDIKESKELLKSILAAQRQVAATAAHDQFTPEAVAAETPEAAVATPEVKAGFWQGARDFVRGPKKDIKAATAGKTPFMLSAKNIMDTVKLEPTADETEQGSKSGWADAASSIAGAIGDVASSAGKKVSKYGRVLKGGLGALAGGLALDFASEKLTESGHEQLGAGADVASSALSGAGTGAMIGSVVPGVGTAIGGAVGGVVGAGVGLYNNWGKLFGKSSGDQAAQLSAANGGNAGLEASRNVDAINASQKAIAAQATGIPAASAANINNTTMVNNQTVMPSRAIVKNTDDSYNRYVLTILK